MALFGSFAKSSGSNIFIPVKHQAAPNLQKANSERNKEISKFQDYIYGGPKESAVITDEVAAQYVTDKETWSKLTMAQKIGILELAGFKKLDKDLSNVNVKYWRKQKKNNFTTPPIREVKNHRKADILEFTQDFFPED